MATHGTPELKELLIQSGYEHHPAMIKHFAGLDKNMVKINQLMDKQ